MDKGKTAGNIPFARPFIGKEEEEACLRVLRSGWLTTGQETLSFEKEFADFLQKPAVSFRNGAPSPLAPEKWLRAHTPFTALAVNSATSGLHLALEACGVGPGDLVLTPSYTFTATAEVVRYLGADAVFVDVSPGGFNMDPSALEETCRRLSLGLPPYPHGHPAGEGLDESGGGTEGRGPRGKLKAVIPVHIGGLACGMEAILEIARRYKLKVIEDAAHAFPALLSNGGDSESRAEGPAYAGTLGDAGVFSFYATKTITTGEGGMIVCRDRETAERISVMRSHGIDRTIWNRYSDTKASWYYEVVEPGFKYNIPDILSAIGRVQLSRAWELLALRERIARRYDEAFAGDRRFSIPPSGPGNARHLYPLRLNPGVLSCTRDFFIEKLNEAGIGTSVHFIPLHIMPYYRNRYHLLESDFPNTMESYAREISLPIWPGMDEFMVERVIAVAKSIAAEYTID
ncbi:MAG: DegT/DnrJ/EryC1/StrS aminotransferase family protein [Treponema sp.]|jgi:dTDP-4-amino-4,6-dideoxygalactose transaminase|nr:DegT/DnrJ/EryC1/StrS aminotransferase family protein [Treponema sp.]